MLATYILIYLAITLAIGIFSNRYIKGSGDFILAGRRLPLFMAASALFATWFGSETILGASSEFVSHGLLGVIEDPFGAALCLILVGAFFARPLYRMGINTFGDFYRIKFGKRVELIASICLVLSYFGWVAAQLVALGIMGELILGIPIETGILLGALVVTIYTISGGLWAVAITDTIQTVMIVVGLVVIAVSLTNSTEGFTEVVNHVPDHFYRFLPEGNVNDIMVYLAAWITIGLGSIPQQDVFQRVMAGKNEKVAVQSSYLGGIMYLTIGLLPLYIGLCANYIDPEYAQALDRESILPQIVLSQTGLGIQVLFFGALISAILSTTSGAILAPATILSENLLKPLFKKGITDKQDLLLVRLSIVLVAAVSIYFALKQGNIYDLVAASSALSLVSLFVPLVAGLYFKRKSELAAISSIATGLLVWLIADYIESSVPSLLLGLLASLIGWIAGILIKRN